MTDCLVLGANGMLGARLLLAARRRGMEAVGAARRDADVLVDITDAAALRAVLQRLKPATVINAAAMVDLRACQDRPAECLAVNGFSVATLADWCAASGAKLVQISTDHYFTGDGDRAHDETAPVTILNHYAASKFVGEQAASMVAGGLILRTNFTGFRIKPGSPTFLEWVIASLQRGDRITSFVDYFTSTIDVGTLAEACFDLLAGGAGGLLNLASSEVADKRRFIASFAECAGLRCEYQNGSVMAMVPRRAESSGLSVVRAESLLGYKLPDLAGVVEKLAEEYERRMHAS